MKGKPGKLTGWLTRLRIATAVGRTVFTGKHGKTFDRIDRGVEIADKTVEIAKLVKLITKN